MKTIRALLNFGFKGEDIPAGTVMDVDPADFGGTFDDFVAAGHLEEGSMQAVAGFEDPQFVAGPKAPVQTVAKKGAAKKAALVEATP